MHDVFAGLDVTGTGVEVGHLAMHKALGFIPRCIKLGMVVHSINSNTQKDRSQENLKFKGLPS